MLFVFSCIVVVAIWGYVGLIVGLIFGGVGVVPVAFVATVAHAEWPAFWSLILGIVLTFGARAFGIYLTGMAKAADDNAYDAP